MLDKLNVTSAMVLSVFAFYSPALAAPTEVEIQSALESEVAPEATLGEFAFRVFEGDSPRTG